MLKVFVEQVSSDTLSQKIGHALEWVDWKELIPSSARVFLKPNLTWSRPMPGVTTTPELIEAVVQAIKSHTSHIIIGESDGGYHSFDAEEALESHGLYDIAKRYGVQVINLSDLPSEEASATVGGDRVTVELPSLLLRDVDVFITLPVPKVHVMTRVSLAFKNQWGCIPKTMRLRNHPQFVEKIIAINKLLKPRIAIFDGTYFLDRTGPMIGDPVRMNLLVAANDIGAGSLACCRIMNIDPWKVKHFTLARQEGMFPNSLDEVVLNQPIESFCHHQFRLERTLINWIALAAFNSDALTQLLYDSAFADPIHRVLYAVRKHRLIGRLLYGEIGPPAAGGARTQS